MKRLLILLFFMSGISSVTWAGPFGESPFQPKPSHKTVQPPPRPRSAEQVLNADRWRKVFQTHRETIYLDKTSVRQCNRVVGVSSLRTCRDVRDGYAYWKRVVIPQAAASRSAANNVKIETGVVDCARREVNFFPLRPNTANAVIFHTLCKKSGSQSL